MDYYHNVTMNRIEELKEQIKKQQELIEDQRNIIKFVKDILIDLDCVCNKEECDCLHSRVEKWLKKK